MDTAQERNIGAVGCGVFGITVAQGLSKKLDHEKSNLVLVER